jgi:hypothetical protein
MWRLYQQAASCGLVWQNLTPPPPDPAPADYIVLSIPAGRYTLTKHLAIQRSRLVLRGTGSGKTTLVIPKSEGQRTRKPLCGWL